MTVLLATPTERCPFLHLKCVTLVTAPEWTIAVYPAWPTPQTPTPPLLESLSIRYLRVSVHGGGVGELGYGPVALSLFRTYNDQVQSLSRVRWLTDVEGFDHSGR